MSKYIPPNQGKKDEKGAYLPPSLSSKEAVVDELTKVQEPQRLAAVVEPGEVPSLELVLAKQLKALNRLTDCIASEIYAGHISKETANQLATCIKVTMELKLKQKDLLDQLPDDELEKIAAK